MNGIGMQDKTIKKKLDRKIEDWLSSIADEEVRRMVRRDVIVTGGSIASMIMGDVVKDYDVYLRTKEAVKAIANYYAKVFADLNPNAPTIEVREVTLENIKGESEDRVVNWISSAGVVKDDSFKTDEDSDEDQNDPDHELESAKGKYVPVFISENAITLSNKIQIVTRFYGEPDKIHSNYDYVHAKCYYDHKNYTLVTPQDALRSMQSKTLRYTGSLYPVCSLFRLRKFISRGWKISAGDIAKMAFQISAIDLTDMKILREQLVGCDALYFHSFISAIKDLGEEKIASTTYLSEILDRIFSGGSPERED